MPDEKVRNRFMRFVSPLRLRDDTPLLFFMAFPRLRRIYHQMCNGIEMPMYSGKGTAETAEQDLLGTLVLHLQVDFLGATFIKKSFSSGTNGCRLQFAFGVTYAKPIRVGNDTFKWFLDVIRFTRNFSFGTEHFSTYFSIYRYGDNIFRLYSSIRTFNPKVPECFLDRI